MNHDIIIRNGTVIDGTGAPALRADVGIAADRIAEIIGLDDGGIDSAGAREIDAEGRLVTPGFVDIHTHLDAQLAWDPIGTSSCWHGVTSVVMGNCGVTFAPCRPEDRSTLAEMMESVEDIPRDAIIDGLAWDWETYGEYYDSIDRLPKGPNTGGLVGHSALRTYVMGERGLDEAPATGDDIAAMARLVDEAMRAGALGVSTSRTLMHKVPDGRAIPGTYAAADELLTFAEVLHEHRAGVFEGAMRLGERDNDDLDNTRAEVALMGEISRRSGRPVSFGLTQSNRRPDLYERVIDFVKSENTAGANVRPQTTARGVGILFGLETRTPFDRAPSWKELRSAVNGRKMQMVRDATFRQTLINEADVHGTPINLEELFVLPAGEARYDCDPANSLAAIAIARGVSPAAAFIELVLETDGALVANMPFLNQDLSAVESMLDDPLVTLGLADAGAHVGQIMDASQPTFFLTYWIRERERWSIEEAIRRLTTDTADLFGIRNRGRLAVGAFADVNVIDFDSLHLPHPEYVNDFPNGAGRYVQGSTGYDYTLVNGYVFMDHGEHTGALAGRMLRSN
ncbi:MAG TPA: amidohydrolase family protein [Ilumatobacteraceae bacterium]|nr:amidohydrolase family protein [Ilumatobacteraceae bacterium]